MATIARTIGALALAAALAGAASCRPAARTDGPRVRFAPAAGASAAFSRALAPRELRLPADHGPHFDYQTEWWYYTGNLRSEDGRRFGFQLTFFRRGLTPGPPPEGPGLATNQIYFAHFALTDVESGSHRAHERFSRGAARLAGASAAPFRVWVEDWEAAEADAAATAVTLRARDGDSGLALRLEASKPLVAHGDRGLSAKSDEPGNASYYLSFTRMAARGELTARGETLAVAGEAWFDHEWSTSALGPGAVGWDWFSLQLDDARELMLFQIRREDGSLEPVSGGTLVAGDGATRRVHRDGFVLEVDSHWTSEASGARYPARWRLAVPEAGLELSIRPIVADQELRTSFTYWEGAVDVSGVSGGAPVSGRGYVELTGYARSMQGVF